MRETADVLQTPDTIIRVQAPAELHGTYDPERLRQALENLLGNALKYAPSQAPVMVEVGTEAETEGKRAVLTVHDEGPGIAADLLPTLFDRFARGRSSTGLGLGLYLARGIAEAHGGTLTVDSQPGRGTTFRLSLPLDTLPSRD